MAHLQSRPLSLNLPTLSQHKQGETHVEKCAMKKEYIEQSVAFCRVWVPAKQIQSPLALRLPGL